MDRMLIAKYIAQGLKPVQVAAIGGVSESYISQVVNDEGVKEEIEELKDKFKHTEQEKSLEKGYQSLEVKLLAKIEEEMPFGEYKDLLKLMEILHRRKAPLATSGAVTNNVTNNIVHLQIPQAAAPEIQLNAQREVVGIANESLAPMSATGVRSLFANLKKEKAEEAKIIEEKKNETLKEEPTIVNLDKM